ncbi:hypothetical protein [Brevundimonas sp. GCM10030266]|uniref:hypothetical protein n=1 Tax=Brevundimonas sp. GCM10030266 TaxID=3273386 RepID=UPI003623DB8E
MTGLLTFMLVAMLGEPTRTLTPCDDLRSIPVGTEVIVEGRYFTDFVHGEALQADSCQVRIGLGASASGPLADRFLDATWRQRPYPMSDSGGVTLRVKGVVQMEPHGHLGMSPQPFIRTAELLNVTVDEGRGQ